MIKNKKDRKRRHSSFLLFAHLQKTKKKIKKETRDRRQTHRASAHLSFAEMGLGVAQIADAFSNNGQNNNLQASSTLVGYTMRQNNMSGADQVDAVVQFIPSLLTAPNGNPIKSLKEAFGKISNSTGATSAIYNTLNAVDESQDMGGFVSNTFQTLYDKYKQSQKSSTVTPALQQNSEKKNKLSNREVNSVRKFINNLNSSESKSKKSN